MVMVMAQIYLNCGMLDEAMDEFETILDMEIGMTVNFVKLTPGVEALQDNPRFQAMMKEYAI